MRIANECDLRSILIVRSIHFSILKGVDRNDYVILLTRQSSSLQMNCGSVTVVSKFLKIVLLNSRVSKRADVFKLSHLISFSKIQLLASHTQRLFTEELGRQSIRPFIPVAFISTLVDKRQLSIAIFVYVVALTISLDERSERIVRIIFDLLKNVHLRHVFRFVCIEHNVNAIRHVVRIDSHTFYVSITVNQNTNLRIPRLA